MKKIGIIKCSGSLNVGNEFINAGGKYLVKQIFPDRHILEYEFFDSAIPQNYKYSTPALLDWAKNELEAECDLMFICSGCIISKYTKAVLEELSKIKIKKVLLGAGAYQYDDFDKKLSIELAKKYDYIFTRDDISFSFFKNAQNVYPSIDLGFYAKEQYLPQATNTVTPENISNYALLNIDLIKDNISTIMKLKKQLKDKFDKIYIIENTTTKYSDIQDFLYIGYSDNLYKVISHASYVVTTRIHTVVACLSNCIPFLYVGSDTADSVGRSSLFRKFGFLLKSNVKYSHQEVKTINDQVEKVKRAEFEKLKLILGSI